MEAIKTDFFVRSSRIANYLPAIYCLASLEMRSLYIGQTNSRLGVLGRFSQHLSQFEGNTFYQRILDIYGYDDVEIENIYGLYYPLPKEARFMNAATDHREAVEALVQAGLIQFAAQKKFCILSRVSRSPLCSRPDLINIASAATKIFTNFIDSLAI